MIAPPLSAGSGETTAAEALGLRELVSRPWRARGRFAVWRAGDEWMTAPLVVASAPRRVGAALAARFVVEFNVDLPAMRRIARGARQDLWREVRDMRGLVPAARVKARDGVAELTLFLLAMDGAAPPRSAWEPLRRVARDWTERGSAGRVLRARARAA